MATHTVKSWAHFFDAISAGRKLHDLRIMDRDYKVGDFIILQKYDNINGRYTGDEVKVEITYITSNKVPCAFSSSALAKDYAILSIKLVPKETPPKAAFRIDDGEVKFEDAVRIWGTGDRGPEVFMPFHEDLRIVFPAIPTKNDPRLRG